MSDGGGFRDPPARPPALSCVATSAATQGRNAYCGLLCIGRGSAFGSISACKSPRDQSRPMSSLRVTALPYLLTAASGTRAPSTERRRGRIRSTGAASSRLTPRVIGAPQPTYGRQAGPSFGSGSTRPRRTLSRSLPPPSLHSQAESRSCTERSILSRARLLT